MVDKIRSHRSASRRWLWQGSQCLPLNLLLSFARRCRPNVSKASQTSQPAVSGVSTNETTTWHMCSAGSKAGWLMALIEGTNDDDDGDKATERKNRFQCCDFPPLVHQFVHHRRQRIQQFVTASSTFAHSKARTRHDNSLMQFGAVRAKKKGDNDNNRR